MEVALFGLGGCLELAKVEAISLDSVLIALGKINLVIQANSSGLPQSIHLTGSGVIERASCSS